MEPAQVPIGTYDPPVLNQLPASSDRILDGLNHPLTFFGWIQHSDSLQLDRLIAWWETEQAEILRCAAYPLGCEIQHPESDLRRLGGEPHPLLALTQGLLGVLAIGDVVIDAKHAQRSAARIAHDATLGGQPAHS